MDRVAVSKEFEKFTFRAFEDAYNIIYKSEP